MHRPTVLILSVLVATGGLGGVAAASVSPPGPVTNSGFEHPPARRTLSATVAGTPADDCYGVGHQALYDGDTLQGQATGGPYGEPNPDQADPAGAAENASQDPEGTVEAQTACDFDRERGTDVVFVHPRQAASRPAGWVTDTAAPSATFGSDLDEDPSDREARIAADGSLSSHNLWQSFASKQQAYTPNATALSIAIENGSIPDAASVELLLAVAPLAAQGPHVQDDCKLTFDVEQLQGALGDDGRIKADPANASFSARRPACEELNTRWNSATTDAERREVLAQTRITMLSFWSWNRQTTEPTVVDDVRLPGASLFAEEAEHARLDPTVQP